MDKDYQLAKFAAIVIIAYPVLTLLSGIKIGFDILSKRKTRLNESFERGERDNDTNTN